MTTHRQPGQEAQNVNSSFATPKRPLIGLYPEVLRGLPFGVVLLQFENPGDVKTFRIVDANPAAAAIAGTTVQKLLGKTLADFPKLADKPFPNQWLASLRSGEPQNLGEISYGDELIKQAVYSV